mgnify:FL=1
MPPSVRDWLPEGDPTWFILDVVEQMDLREFYGAYREDGWGGAAYNPGMMAGVLLYAYCQGIRSSRRIGWALERDVGFRVMAANQQPDFRTICRFGETGKRSWSSYLCRCWRCAARQGW